MDPEIACTSLLSFSSNLPDAATLGDGARDNRGSSSLLQAEVSEGELPTTRHYGIGSYRKHPLEEEIDVAFVADEKVVRITDKRIRSFAIGKRKSCSMKKIKQSFSNGSCLLMQSANAPIRDEYCVNTYRKPNRQGQRPQRP